jgi:hypothetical protein
MTFPLHRFQPIAARRVETVLGFVVGALLAALFTLFTASPVFAESDLDGEEAPRNWLRGFSPYLSTGPFTTIQRVRASINTDFGISKRSANTLTNLGWMFEAGVQSPRFEDLPGKPRFGVAGGILLPLNAAGTIGSSVEIIVGQFNDQTKEETKLFVDYKNSYRAGFGVEFLFDVLPVDLRLTPGLEYLYFDSRYNAEVASTRTFVSEADPVVRSARSKVNLVQHFVGPSLRIATEPVDVFGLKADLFIQGSLLFDVAGTRRFRSQRDEQNRRSSFNWEAGSTAGIFSAGFRVLLP